MTLMHLMLFFFFFNDTATTEIYTLSLHDALPICDFHASTAPPSGNGMTMKAAEDSRTRRRSEEHTSELQSPCNLVCRLLLEKKKEYVHPHIRYQIPQHRTHLSETPAPTLSSAPRL